MTSHRTVVMGLLVLRIALASLFLCSLAGCAEGGGSTVGDPSRLHSPTNDGGVFLPVVSDGGGLDAGRADASLPCGSFAQAAGATYPSTTGSYFEFQHGGRTRQFKVHVPKSYRNGTPSPVVFAFHGMTGNAESFGINGTGLAAKADAAGFVLVLPNGYQHSWNAGSCCGQAQKQGVDDVGFVREVHARLASQLGLCIDPSRVYATGYSNGGIFTYRLACEASDLFASVASVSGTMAIPYDQCGPSMRRPMPFLEIHGVLDKITPLLGSNGKGTLPSLATLAGDDGCSSTTTGSSVPPSQLDTSCETHLGCGSGTEVTLCRAANGGHCWFGSSTCGTGSPYTFFLGGNATGIVATDAIWSFVSRFHCPTCGR